MGCCFIQVSLLILVTSTYGQQFNSSPIQTFPQQEFSPSQTFKTENNYTSLERIRTPQNDIKQTVFPAVRHNRQSSPNVKRSTAQPLEPATSTSIPNQSSLVQPTSNSQSFEQTKHFQQIRQTVPVNPSQHFHIPSLPPSQQIFQLTTPFPDQRQAHNPIQITQKPALQNQRQNLVPNNQASQINNEIRATPVQQITRATTEINSVIQNQQPSTSTIFLQQQEQTSRIQTTTPTLFSSLPQQTLTNGVLQSKAENLRDFQPQLQKPQKADVRDQLNEEVTLSPEQILFDHQAKNAKYSFNSAITDDIMDNMQIREEARDGLLVTGLYSYSDGFFKRTVHYVADENGYRVTKEEVEPIGTGPQLNLDGQATISSNFGGIRNKYTITAADIARLHKNETT